MRSAHSEGPCASRQAQIAASTHGTRTEVSGMFVYTRDLNDAVDPHMAALL
jgi:hypothetical protein